MRFRTPPCGAAAGNRAGGLSASECITAEGNAAFPVADSAISNATTGAPGGYPSIYAGCHWGPARRAGLVSRGYAQSSWYLIDGGAGFELWQGGAGLAINSLYRRGRGGIGGNASYDAVMAAGGSVTVGSTAAYTSTNAAPASVSCT